MERGGGGEGVREREREGGEREREKKKHCSSCISKGDHSSLEKNKQYIPGVARPI